MLRATMSYLSAADATEMAAEAQAECLLAQEEMDAVKTHEPPPPRPRGGRITASGGAGPWGTA